MTYKSHHSMQHLQLEKVKKVVKKEGCGPNCSRREGSCLRVLGFKKTVIQIENHRDE